MHKYPKILTLGQELISEIFDSPVEITEKVDGSQCRIRFTDSHVTCGSKNMAPADSKMFALAHKQAERMWEERIWWTYGIDLTIFCEFLNKEKHNVLIYGRVPLNNLYLFGAIADGKHLKTEDLIELAKDLEIEPPFVLASEKTIESQSDIEEYLTLQSGLGGTIVEGMVIKNYGLSYPPLLTSTQAFFGYPLAGKLVRDDFKERLNKTWNRKKQREDPLTKVTAEFLTSTRFRKTIQHLEEDGKCEYEMRMLKDLIPEFYNDLLDEEKDEIVKIAMVNFWAQLRRKSDAFVVGEWKKYLLERQFEE